MDKMQKAIERLRMGAEISMSYYNAPLIITDSGGKDSAVLVDLALKAKIPIEIHHNHTTADAPDTVRYVRQKFHRLECEGYDVRIIYPTYKGKPVSMWSLIPQVGMPPTRLMRYCCNFLKEQGEKNRMIATGVRWAESSRRKGRGVLEVTNKKPEKRVILMDDNDDKRRVVERCELKARTVVNPIVDWSDRDVWDYLAYYGIPVNQLYSCGFHRVGCIGCPMAGRKARLRDFSKFPEYKRLWLQAFDRLLQTRKEVGKPLRKWESAESLFRGKSVWNGLWLYGEFVNDPDPRIVKHSQFGNKEGIVSLSVDPATVGQYTGLKDKNGQWIFEGDVLTFTNKYYKITTTWKCFVEFAKGAFVCRYVLEDYEYNHFDFEGWHNQSVEWEVIGNIYDNPALLEGGDRDGAD